MLPLLISCRLNCDKKIYRPVSRIFLMKSLEIHSTPVLLRKQATDLNDEPVKFSASKAKDHVSFVSERRYPRHFSNSLLLSMTVFFLYFFVLREENDIDEKVEAIFSIQELDILRAIEYATIAGRDTTELEQKLAELRKNKVAQK